MDLTTEDELGQPWDFSKEHMKEKARRKLRQQKPDLLVGSPMCTLYSAWQRLNKGRDIKAYRKRLREARTHLVFVCELYLEQAEAGRLFLHEHPDSASPWTDEQCIRNDQGRCIGRRDRPMPVRTAKSRRQCSEEAHAVDVQLPRDP